MLAETTIGGVRATDNDVFTEVCLRVEIVLVMSWEDGVLVLQAGMQTGLWCAAVFDSNIFVAEGVTMMFGA